MAEQARYDSYMSPEDRLDIEKRNADQSRTFDEKFKDSYASLERKSRTETYGRGQGRKQEVLGNFHKSWLSLKGMRARLYAFEIGKVNALEGRMEKCQNKIDLIRKDMELYQQAIAQLSETTRWWQVGQRASLGIESAATGFSAGMREIPHQLGIDWLSMLQSADKWLAEVFKGDIDQKYNRAIHDLKSTEAMEKIIGRYYSKALVLLPVNPFSSLFEDPEKNQKMRKIALLEGNEFLKEWEEFRSTLTNQELVKLDEVMTSNLEKKDQAIVKRLRTQIKEIYARPDVHDYHEIKYLQDVQKNMNSGKRLYAGLGLLESSDVKGERAPAESSGMSPQVISILKRLKADQNVDKDKHRPNIVYMLCDAVNFYTKGTKKPLHEALAELLVTKDGVENKEFIDRLTSIKQKGVNDLVKVNFYVRNELRLQRREALSTFRSQTDAQVVNVTLPVGLNIRRDFMDIPVVGRTLFDVAYDVYTHKRIKAFVDPQRSRMALHIAARLLQSLKTTFDPKKKLSESDFASLR